MVRRVRPVDNVDDDGADDDEGLGLGIEPHIAQFASTVIRFDDPKGWHQVEPAESRSGGPFVNAPCHVISAVHSHKVIDGKHVLRNVSVPPEYSTRRTLDLWYELRYRGTWVGEAVGVAPDLSYGEISVAVGGLTREEAVEIGRRYGQLAIFEIGHRKIRVIGCLVDGVLSTSPYAQRFLGDVRPCPMLGGFDAVRGGKCGPPVVRAAGAGREAIRWKEQWFRAYGLLGCDMCKGEQRW